MRWSGSTKPQENVKVIWRLTRASSAESIYKACKTTVNVILQVVEFTNGWMSSFKKKKQTKYVKKSDNHIRPTLTALSMHA